MFGRFMAVCGVGVSVPKNRLIVIAEGDGRALHGHTAKSNTNVRGEASLHGITGATRNTCVAPPTLAVHFKFYMPVRVAFTKASKGGFYGGTESLHSGR